MDKKTILAVVLSLVILIGYQYFFLKPKIDQEKANQQPSTTVEMKTQELLKQEASEAVVSEKQTLAEKNEAGQSEGKDITVATPLYSAVFNTQGTALTSFKLKKYRQDITKEADMVELINVPDGFDNPLTVVFPDSSIDVSSKIIYTESAESIDLINKNEPRQLVFSWEYPEKIKIDKIYTFYPDKYMFDLEIQVSNFSEAIINEKILIAWNQRFASDDKEEKYSHVGPVSYIDEKLYTEKIKKLKEPEYRGPGVSWGGYESKYFVAAMIPERPSLTRFFAMKEDNDFIKTALEGPKSTILPGQSGTFKYSLYLGPKDYDILKSVNAGLENSINFGSWLKWLALPLLMALKFIYGFVHNYGIAIIILTILVKIIFWPLGNISYRSMKNMQKLQPKMLEIREKFKDDKARMNQETMALYKTHKVNPMSGCLPMVIQIPVFFGLYKALLYSIELRHSPFFFWIQDLSAKDPYYITPVIMGATMFLQQRMSPVPAGNEMQAKMMMWMPVIFTFLFLGFPAGLVIYWLFNNIISIGQQYYINKSGGNTR